MICFAVGPIDAQLVTIKETITHVIEATDAVLANVNGLNDYPRLLLASLFLCSGHCGPEGWRIATMTDAFRDLLEQKGLGDSECQNFRLHFGQVFGYGLLAELGKVRDLMLMSVFSSTVAPCGRICTAATVLLC